VGNQGFFDVLNSQLIGDNMKIKVFLICFTIIIFSQVNCSDIDSMSKNKINIVVSEYMDGVISNDKDKLENSLAIIKQGDLTQDADMALQFSKHLKITDYKMKKITKIDSKFTKPNDIKAVYNVLLSVNCIDGKMKTDITVLCFVHENLCKVGAPGITRLYK